MKRYCVVAITNDPPHRLIEFILYYHIIGFHTIFLYLNHGHEDISGVETAIQKYTQTSGKNVRAIRFGGKGQQFPSYNHFFTHFRKDYEYAFFVDTDEFLYMKTHNDIADILCDYDRTLLIPRKEFGNNEIEKYEQHKTQLDTFTEVINCFHGSAKRILVKSLVYLEGWTQGTKCVHNIQRWGYLLNSDTVSNGPFVIENETIFDTWQLNHYYTRSFKEFSAKFNGLRADTSLPKSSIQRMHIALAYIRKKRNQLVLDEAMKNSSIALRFRTEWERIIALDFGFLQKGIDETETATESPLTVLPKRRMKKWVLP